MPSTFPDKTIAGKYAILTEIGRGGMGVVYKARDTRLRRDVALKFLPAELTQDKEAKKRFIREAQAAAALDHSNICTVYEVNDFEGKNFIVMSYIEGQSLKDRLEDGPLEIDEAKDIIFQAAEGLKEAHEKGVVHRDIKPANIMLTKKGQVKITDFGLAKLSWGADLTKTSMIMGTLAYMSPEQAKGEKVDHRTDIWSLGAMLYEMLTGERPFKKDHEQALIFSILNDDPKSVSSLRSDIPIHIEDVIHIALEKDASKRFQSTDEFIKNLKSPPAISHPKSGKSIAVLPFTNMSADPEQEYFCDGMAEEIINSLTNIKDLRVAARTSSFSFKGKDVDIREIGRKLNVEKVLEGSVRKSGSRLRITAQLINVEDGYHLWSERFDRDMDDVFEIQDEITLAIVAVLRAKLLKDEKVALLKQSTENKEAYNLYLKGRHFMSRLTAEGWNKAIDLFEEAIKKDPGFALAYADLTESYVNLCWGLGICPPKDSMKKAKKAAEKAVELDPDLADAQKAAAIIKGWYDWDLLGAKQCFKRALELSPNSPSIHLWYGLFLTYFEHDLHEAFKELKKAEELDPLDLIIKNHLIIQYFWLQDMEKAQEVVQDILSLDPHNAFDHHLFADCYDIQGNIEKAIAQMKEAIRLGGRAINNIGELAQLYVQAGKTKDALEIVRELEDRAQNTSAAFFFIAGIYARLGDKEKAFEFLERAYEEKDLGLLWGSLYFTRLEGYSEIAEDPRWSHILKKMGLSHLAPIREGQKNSDTAENQSPEYEKSIVVLPFDDVSPDKDNEYFSDGLTEEIISDLSKIQDLRVISRTSTMMLKGTRRSMQTIARELGVQYVLEGSVRKAGNNLRITAQLIDASNDAHLWAEKYSGTLDEIFEIQEKVSRAIVDALKMKLTPDEEKKMTERLIDHPQAYELYLKAREELYTFSEESLERALDYVQKALKITGDNVLIFSVFGHIYFQFYNMGIRIENKYLDLASSYAHKIVEIDPNSPKACSLLGPIKYKEGNVQEAVRQLKKALVLDPSDYEALGWIVYMYGDAGKTDIAYPLSSKLRKVEPLNPNSQWGYGWLRTVDGSFEMAKDVYRQMYKMDTRNPLSQMSYGVALAYTDEMTEAYSLFDQIIQDDPESFYASLASFYTYGLKKNVLKARNSTNKEMMATCEKDEYYSLRMAEGFSLIDDKNEAIKWLENSVNRGLICYPFLNKYNPFLKNIRGEERFKKLMKRVKREWENFEV